jgi:hypothetical protein
VLLDDADNPAVSDFGLVKSADDDGPATDPCMPGVGSAETHPSGPRRSKTLVGAVLGTRSYMSPEQANGRADRPDPRWDVWALGVMLHELVTGQLPRSSDAPERLLDASQPDNPSASTIRTDLDPRLAQIIGRCLARDPARRYPNGAAVAAELGHWLRRGHRVAKMVAVAVLFLATVGLAAGAIRPRNRPDPNAADAIVKEIQDELRAGKTVDLIGPDGNLRWFQVVSRTCGDGPYVTDLTSGGRMLWVRNDQMILVDLPPTGLDRYRFEVEVEQQTAGPTTDIGVYAGRHTQISKSGEPVDCFATLIFNNTTPVFDKEPPGWWTMGMRTVRQFPLNRGGSWVDMRQFRMGRYIPGPQGNKWHKLAVEVAPVGLKWYFDGEQVGGIAIPVDPGEQANFIEQARLMPASIDFSPGGGYGLVVHHGAATFRNVRLMPLEP